MIDGFILNLCMYCVFGNNPDNIKIYDGKKLKNDCLV